MIEWKNKLVNLLNQKRYKATFISAIVTAVIAHGFALINVLHNYDNISVFLKTRYFEKEEGKQFMRMSCRTEGSHCHFFFLLL